MFTAYRCVADFDTQVASLSSCLFSAAANATSNAMTKATDIVRAVNGSGYGSAGNLLQYVTNLAQQPVAWFNLSASFVGIDPPGQLCPILDA